MIIVSDIQLTPYKGRTWPVLCGGASEQKKFLSFL